MPRMTTSSWVEHLPPPHDALKGNIDAPSVKQTTSDYPISQSVIIGLPISACAVILKAKLHRQRKTARHYFHGSKMIVWFGAGTQMNARELQVTEHPIWIPTDPHLLRKVKLMNR